MISLRTLGPFDLRDARGQEVSAILGRQRRTALLVFLAVESRRGLVRRDSVAAVFWPELDQSKARAALRQALYVLRSELGEDVIVSRGGDEVGISTALTCDAVLLEQHVERGEFEQALALYQGDFLTGFFISDAPEFERWVDEQREQLRRHAVDCAIRLAEGSPPTDAARYLRRAWQLAPTNEELIRRLMLLLDSIGQRAQAIDAYDDLAIVLQREYDLQPSQETMKLLDSIRQRVATHAPMEPLPAHVPQAKSRDTIVLPPLRPRRPWALIATIPLIVGTVAAIALQRPEQHLAAELEPRRVDVLPSVLPDGQRTRANPNRPPAPRPQPGRSALPQAGEVVALDALARGDLDVAARYFRERVNEHPDDAEAWVRLGEVLFRTLPLTGQSLADAAAPFQRALELDQHRRPALEHLTRVAASTGNAKLLDWVSARLNQGGESPSAREAVLMRAVLRRDRAEINALARGFNARRLQPVARSVAVHTGDIPTALKLLEIELNNATDDQQRAASHASLAMLELARGNWARAEEHLASMTQLARPVGELLRGMLIAQPFVPATRDELMAARTAVEFRLEPQPSEKHQHRPAPPMLHPLIEAQGMLRLSTGAILSLRLADTTEAARRMATMLDLPLPDPAKPLQEHLLADLRARLAVARGDHTAALRELEQIPLDAAFPPQTHVPSSGQRYLRAQLLAGAGQRREALRWYNTFEDQSLFQLVFAGPGHLQMAEVCEQLKDTSCAARHYRAFLELWSDPDAALKPLVERARARLARLER